jgi:hypothetical protein
MGDRTNYQTTKNRKTTDGSDPGYFADGCKYEAKDTVGVQIPVGCKFVWNWHAEALIIKEAQECSMTEFLRAEYEFTVSGEIDKHGNLVGKLSFSLGPPTTDQSKVLKSKCP